MASMDGALFDFRRLDELATGATTLHRLDPRAKVLVTLVFIVTVVSFGKYELAPLFPFIIFPAVMIGLGDLPAGFIMKKIALVFPFALAVGVFNPILDREILVRLGPVEISGGWISCASIMVRAALTVGAVFILASVTGFTAICRALERLGMPRIFAVQLLFLYRYIFVLTEEAARASRARELRSCGQRGLEMRTWGSLVGHLLLRTWERAERVYRSMLGRGFTGEFHTSQATRFGFRDLVFLGGWSALFVILRLTNIPLLLGSLATGMFP